LRALALRSSGLSLAALIFPPLEPPSFPSATAFGFFSRIDSEPYMPATVQKINKKALQGLHLNQRGVENKLEGIFLVRVDRARYRWHPQKPFVEIRFVVLEPKPFEARLFSGRLYCTERAFWKLNWFLRDFGYDAQLLKDDQVDEKALANLRGVVRTSYSTLNGRSYQKLGTDKSRGYCLEMICADFLAGANLAETQP
jgi:hypothetical protein